MNCDEFEAKLTDLAASPVSIVMDDRSDAPVLPDLDEEMATLSPAGVAHARLDDFRRGRACARAAIVRLGQVPGAVLRDGRAPRWPDTIIGSITHCSGLVAAAVARRHEVRGIGIDAEPRGRVPEKLVPRIGTIAEFDAVATISSRADGSTLLWCVKEAVFKCVDPLFGRFIDFLDVTIAPDLADATFTARSADRGRDIVVPTMRGIFAFSDTHVMAGCVVCAQSPRSEFVVRSASWGAVH